METLSHILASFDLFQVILNAFPGIFTPIIHAFQAMISQMFHLAVKLFVSHPGLTSGTIIFLCSYLTWLGISKMRKAIVPAHPTASDRGR